jgi:hypothetical protein
VAAVWRRNSWWRGSHRAGANMRPESIQKHVSSDGAQLAPSTRTAGAGAAQVSDMLLDCNTLFLLRSQPRRRSLYNISRSIYEYDPRRIAHLDPWAERAVFFLGREYAYVRQASLIRKPSRRFTPRAWDAPNARGRRLGHEAAQSVREVSIHRQFCRERK